jgi:hypothetical protein
MTHIDTLWLPILLSSVGVFILSAVIHMFLPWHKSDLPKVPNEEKVREALRPLGIPPGEYVVPRAQGSKEMKSPEYAQKLKEGPVLALTVRRNGSVQMGSRMVAWFVYLIVVDIFVAYISGRALPAGATYLDVFRSAGTIAFSCYVVAQWEMPIWWWRSIGLTIKATIDGLIYAVVTAGIFGWLWPR